jgi:hypothetical protein
MIIDRGEQRLQLSLRSLLHVQIADGGQAHCLLPVLSC